MMLAVLVMFWVQLPSLRQLDQQLRVNEGLRGLLKRHTGYGLAFCPGEGELTAAKRLLARMGKVYGEAIGIRPRRVPSRCASPLPMRFTTTSPCASWRASSITTWWSPTRTRGASRDAPESGHWIVSIPSENDHIQIYETDEYRYECWEVDLGGGWRYIQALRFRMKVAVITDEEGNKRVKRHKDKAATVHKAAIITDLPPERAPAVAVAMLFEARWWVENTAFHELAGNWKFDRIYVHDPSLESAPSQTPSPEGEAQMKIRRARCGCLRSWPCWRSTPCRSTSTGT